jgi:hypothetical protein
MLTPIENTVGGHRAEHQLLQGAFRSVRILNRNQIIHYVY